MKILSDFRNDLIKRKEIVFELESAKNPSFPEVKTIVANHFKVSEDNVSVKSIRGGFGKNVFQIGAFVYDSIDVKNHLEPVKKKAAVGGAQ